MGSSEPSSANDPRDWELLASLFAQDGPYRHRMGLRRFAAAEFYAPTPEGAVIRAERAAILNRAGERHTLVTPEGHLAAVEFAGHLRLPVEAPSESGDEGWSTLNRRLGVMLEPDLLFVQPPDWTLVWANVCFPSHWSLEGTSRRPLTWIHGAVPDLNPELADKIAVFFSRLTPGEGWRRANWGLSASASLNQHPDEGIPRLEAGPASDTIIVRIEHQHLLKLPESGAIAFGIRILNFLWREVIERPSIASALLEKLNAMPSEIARYKGLENLIPSLPEKY